VDSNPSMLPGILSSRCLILGLGASTTNGALDVAREFDEAKKEITLCAVAKIGSPQWLEENAFVEKFNVGVRDFTRYLTQYKPHVLHVSAHGDKDVVFLVQADTNEVASAQLLVDVLRNTRQAHSVPDLVVLNCCNSEGIAHRLVHEANIPFAIGTNGMVPDRATIAFSQIFYSQLALGESLSGAFRQACAYADDAMRSLLPRLPENAAAVLPKFILLPEGGNFSVRFPLTVKNIIENADHDAMPPGPTATAGIGGASVYGHATANFGRVTGGSAVPNHLKSPSSAYDV